MAVENIPFNSTLQLVYDYGVDGDGKSVTRRRSFSNVKTAAIDQDIYDVASSMIGLQSMPVTHILLLDKAELIPGI